MTLTTKSLTETGVPEQRAKSFFEADSGIANRIAFFLTAFNAFRDFEHDAAFALNQTTFAMRLAFQVDGEFDRRFFIFGICHFKDENFTFPAIQFVAEGFGAEIPEVVEGFTRGLGTFA